MSRNVFYERGVKAGIGRAFNTALHSVYLDRAPDYRRSVFICGAPRSGTTWLAELVNHANRYRYVYEPFNREHVPLCRHFSERQYLRPGDPNPVFLEPARAIFAGRIRNAWVDQHNRQIAPRQRLIKDVRSTLMLKWIREAFPGMPVVFVIRHPCAVASSRLTVGYANDLYTAFLSQPALMSDHLGPYNELLTRPQSAFEHQVTDWCVENYVPLATLDKGDVYLAVYEKLCLEPANELRKIFSFLGIPFDDSLSSRLARPSSTSRRRGSRSALFSGESLVDGWRKHVSAADHEAAKRIIGSFGLDRIYGDGSLATPESIEPLLTAAPARSR